MGSESTASAPSWADFIGRFVGFLRGEDAAAHTRKCYEADLKGFGKWYRDRRGQDPELAQLTNVDFIDWKDDLLAHGGRNGGPGARQTVNRKIAAAAKLLRWAQDERLIPAMVKAPKRIKRSGKPIAKSLDEDQFKALLHAVELNAKPRFKTRDRVIILLGSECGLRVEEMANLLWSDIEISERKGELTVRHGKGGKERTIPLHLEIRKALAALGFEKFEGKNIPVLEGQRGPLSIRGIQEICERYGSIARVGKRVGIPDFSVHRLRHTFGCTLAEKGVPITTIQELMGHADVKTTADFYLIPTGKSKEKAIDSLADDRRF
jgi:site-specific recombinase XerD